MKDHRPRPVFFLSDGTGITAETFGNTLLTQFPRQRFTRETVPFISTPDQAHQVTAQINRLAAAGPLPLIFSTAISPGIRDILAAADAHFVDLIGTHLGLLEQALGTRASGKPGRAHSQGNTARYQSRMAAVEYAIEHDDGQSIRALENAELILIAPSRCGKTPTTTYLALQHGILAANFPLVDEDFDQDQLPAPLMPHLAKCFGLTSTPLRLHQIRTGRRPSSNYSSLQQCDYELRSAEHLYARHGIPHLNSSAMSVEEIAATILQRTHLHH